MEGVSIMGIASLVIAMAALVLFLVALIPYIGFLNWLVVPLALLGAILGLMGLRLAFSKSAARAGLIINVILLILALVILF